MLLYNFLILLICVNESLSLHDISPFYIIAHMTNSRKSLEYAMRENANAIEADLRFDKDNNPYKFEHGGYCECSCIITTPMCTHGVDNACEGPSASQLAVDHLNQAATYPQLALVVIDSKVESIHGNDLTLTGRKVIPFIDEHLFGRGYKGNVVISASSVVSFEYIRAASEEANKSPNAKKYFFTFDQEGNSYDRVVENLSRITNQRVFGTGVIVCLPFTYYSGIRKSAAGKRQGEIGMTYIWTLDSEESMLSYIGEGVNGVMTNSPGKLARLASTLGLTVATPSSEIPSSKTYVYVTEKSCDCNYNSGGCTISRPPPPYFSCKCKYLGWKLLFWACLGEIRVCNHKEIKCQKPDASLESCLLGGGNCGGY